MARSHLTVTVPLTIALVGLDMTGAVSCPSCGVAMDLHQPDSNDPDRMLATCEECGAWSILDLLPGGREAALVILPGGDHFRRAIVG